jgi:hypothetical protein
MASPAAMTLVVGLARQFPHALLHTLNDGRYAFILAAAAGVGGLAAHDGF